MALTILDAVVDLRVACRMHHRGCCRVLMPDTVVRSDKPGHNLQRQQKTEE